MDYILVAHLPQGRQSWPLPEGETVIGRFPPSQVLLPPDSVSKVHAKIRRRGDQFEIQDLDSKNGTWLNQQEVHAVRPFAPGDIITIATVALQVDRADPKRSFPPTPAADLDWAEVHTLPPAPRDEGALGRLLDLGGFLVRRHDRREICELGLDKAREIADSDLACLFLLGDSGLVEEVRRFASGLDHQPTFSHTLLEQAIRDRSPILVTECIDPSVSMIEQHIRSALVLPLLDDERILGVLYLDLRRSARMYTVQDLRRVELLAAALALKLANSDLRAEQDQAGCAQRSLLPRSLSVPPVYEAFARLEPCAKVAGDLYDVLPLRDGRYALVLGDVCGKGMGAALLMASVLATFRALANQVDDVLKIVERLGDHLCGCLTETSYVTLFAGILDSERHALSYVNAGHGAALLLHADGSYDELSTTGTPVGMRLGVPYGSRTIDLPRGSLLCTWSDGLHEAQRTDVEPVRFFGEERLIETFVEMRGAPLDELAGRVFDDVDAFQGSAQAHDDRTLLLLRRRA